MELKFKTKDWADIWISEFGQGFEAWWDSCVLKKFGVVIAPDSLVSIKPVLIDNSYWVVRGTCQSGTTYDVCEMGWQDLKPHQLYIDGVNLAAQEMASALVDIFRAAFEFVQCHMHYECYRIAMTEPHEASWWETLTFIDNNYKAA